MWLHQFVCMCVRFYVVWIEAQHISHMFTISSDYFLQIVLFCFFLFAKFRCFTFVFSANPSTMKVAPSILQPPSIKSGSLYFYKGVQIQPGSKDPELAEVYFRRVTVARAATTEARTRWQQKVASELASCTSPEPCVLKSKWKVKRAISADNVLNNVESLRAKLRKQIAADKSWKVKVWI